jgi:DNA-binding CsgD family transcriptional regulator
MAGMSYEEIGYQLGMEREAVQAHLADALVQVSRASRLADS